MQDRGEPARGQSEETELFPEQTFRGRITDRPRIFTDQDGVGVVAFKAILEEKDGLHKRHIVAHGKDLVNYTHSSVKVGQEIIITGEYYVHRKHNRSGKNKSEKRIRASAFHVL